MVSRAFNRRDTYDAPRVVIVNRSAAKRLWPEGDPIGKRIRRPNGPWFTVVGVVSDVRQQLDRSPEDETYVPLQQNPLLGTTWVLHSTLPADELIGQIKRIARAHDEDLPVANFRTLAEVRSTALAPRRVVVSLIGMFGVLALVITAAGIAGVIAFSVNQRTQEFGIRMALAPRASVALVVREGLVLVAIGLAPRMFGAIVLTRALTASSSRSSRNRTALLFNITATDSPTYAGVRRACSWRRRVPDARPPGTSVDNGALRAQ